MKRIALFVVSFIFTLSLTGCSPAKESSSFFTATEDNLGCTPQELIDVINSAVNYVKETNIDSNLRNIPDYEEPGILSIVNIHLYMDISVDEAGKITELELGCIPNTGTLENMSTYLYAIAACYSETGESDIIDDYETAITRPKHEYSYKVTYDGVQYDFHCSGDTLHTIEITPCPDAQG